MHDSYFTRKSLVILISLFCPNLQYAQSRTVSATVKDTDSSEGTLGATICIKGTTRGIITDPEGKFTLEKFSPEDVLIFSFAGYKTLDLPADERTEFNVEFGFEWQRFFDCVRWSLLLGPWVDCEELMEGFVKAKNEYLPLPQHKINLSGGKLIQNPGW